MIVSVTQSELVSGSSLSLTCTITHPSSVDTPTIVMPSWTAPNTDPVSGDDSVELMISSVETADSGDYICSATLTDSSDSVYVVVSEPATDTVSITVSKWIIASYTSLHTSIHIVHRIECDHQCKLYCSSWGRS